GFSMAIERPHGFGFPFRSERVAKGGQPASKRRQALAHLLQNRLRSPHKDSAVPVEQTRLEIPLGGGEIRLFHETRHGQSLERSLGLQRRAAGCADVPVSR